MDLAPSMPRDATENFESHIPHLIKREVRKINGLPLGGEFSDLFF